MLLVVRDISACSVLSRQRVSKISPSIDGGNPLRFRKLFERGRNGDFAFRISRKFGGLNHFHSGEDPSPPAFPLFFTPAFLRKICRNRKMPAGHQSEDDGYMSMNGRKAKMALVALRPVPDCPEPQDPASVSTQEFPPPPEEAERIISTLLPM